MNIQKGKAYMLDLTGSKRLCTVTAIEPIEDWESKNLRKKGAIICFRVEEAMIEGTVYLSYETRMRRQAFLKALVNN